MDCVAGDAKNVTAVVMLFSLIEKTALHQNVHIAAPVGKNIVYDRCTKK